jgi:hypothetical protein
VPRFPFFKVDTPIHLSQLTPNASRDDYQLNLGQNLTTIHTEKYQIKISPLLLALHELSTFLNCASTHILPWDAAYPDRVYEVEYQILLALFDDCVVAEFDEKIMIGIVLLHSGLLFIYTNLRETPVGGVIRDRLLLRLRAALASIDLPSCSKSFLAEILWVLFLGACASTGSMQAHFLDEIRKTCLNGQIQSWLEIRQLFLRAPALVNGCLTKCMDLWSIIERVA